MNDTNNFSDEEVISDFDDLFSEVEEELDFNEMVFISPYDVNPNESAFYTDPDYEYVPSKDCVELEDIFEKFRSILGGR